MDDTLYDEIDYYKSGFSVIAEKIAREFGLNNENVRQTLWEVFQNKSNRKNTFNIAAEKLDLRLGEQYIKELISIFRNHRPNIVLPDESRRVLVDLKKGYKLGIVTDGWMPAQELKVKALELENFFDSIIYTEKLGRQYWKPSTRGFEKLLEELEVNASEAVYVADNLEKDFIAPNKMGFKTIRIVRVNGIHRNPAGSKDAQGQYEIDSLTKINDILKKINAL
jgi:putative hydrolase of the HAD superfamily